MRKVFVLTAAMLAVCVASSFAMKEVPASRSDINDVGSFLEPQMQGPLSAFADTVYFGGGGTGNGSVVRGGTWNWEASSGEPPQFFVDGDPVGNQYRDGWTFDDRTARNGPSATGAGHWDVNGTYNFNNDGGSFAHRATTHANNGRDNGPDPLQGAWSLWIGTNLHLNPENCGWGQIAGYGDGWSQGFQKSYAIAAGNLGASYDLRFFHRYACEAGFDTNWVEISLDGQFWDQVGTTDLPNGIFNDGDFANPKPSAAGGTEVVNLITWPTNNAGNLYVRFRLASDAFFSDNNEGGNFFWTWQIDNVELLRNGVSQGQDTFEAGLNGWQPKSFEGYDFATTTTLQPAGRIESISNLACPPIVDCPESCGLENRLLLFADKDDCDMNDSFQDTYATSRAFAIGGPTQPDLDGAEGRLFTADLYLDGGAGFFETGPTICWVYWPFNANNCPYTPPAGAPGAGITFNWSQTGFNTCDFFSMGTGTDCVLGFLDDVSANLPADADSVILHIGAFSQCRSDAACDIADNGAPFYDNMRFGVFDPAGISITSNTIDRFTDNFPTQNGSVVTTPVRTDGAHSFSQNLGIENPLRWVRADTAAALTGASNTAMYLRWAVERGPCQPNLNHPFFVAFPPSAPGTFPAGLIWHQARMDSAQAQGTGELIAGGYMTCFHESDPRNGTFWTGVPPAVEPCDDILPDGLFTAGTTVYYFLEARLATTGAVTGTFPAARGKAPLKTTATYKDFWLQINNLPTLTAACDGTYANNMLLISDYQTNAVPGRGTIERDRMVATLSSLGLDFDVYDVVGTNYTGSYDGIGRREDRPTQQPRPPYNGATDLMLNNYDCIWYTGGLLDSGVMLSDRRTLSLFGGQSSIDQQKLETWVTGCTAGNNRLLVLDGIGWASFIDVNTTNGPQFLSNRGVDVLADDYAQDLANNDLRRCARIVGQGPGAGFTGEIFGSGCPDNLNIDVFAAISNGEAVANFVESLEDGDDPVNCADDQNRPAWLSVVRRRNPARTCEHSVAMSFAFSEMNPLNCADQCLFNEYKINGANAELVIDLFQWAGCPINANPIGVDPVEAPRFVNELYQAQPNPANPAATIRYTIAQKGDVSLKIFDVSGRLVRTLVNQVQEPAATPFEVVWDGTNDGGQHVGSGVFFYQIDAPGFSSSKKLVILK